MTKTIVKNSSEATGLPAFLTMQDAAEYLNVGVTLVKVLVQTGELPNVRIGHKTVRISRDDFIEFINERRYSEKRD